MGEGENTRGWPETGFFSKRRITTLYPLKNPVSLVVAHKSWTNDQCPIRNAQCPVWPMPNAQCPMPHAQCPMPNAQCPMPNAQCPMPNDQFAMTNSQCPMPNAQCPMPNDFGFLYLKAVVRRRQIVTISLQCFTLGLSLWMSRQYRQPPR